ncbi:MAG: MGMT family protein [Pseudanabaena sp. ELA607]
MSTYSVIYDIVKQIPYGQVATYGQIADLAGLAGKARLVGYALYQVDTECDGIPWHRVVNAKGMVSHSPLRRGTDHWQQSLLEKEGIIFDAAGKLNLCQYRWQPQIYPENITKP